MFDSEPEVERLLTDGESAFLRQQRHSRQVARKRIEGRDGLVSYIVKLMIPFGPKVLTDLVYQGEPAVDNAQARLGEHPGTILQRCLRLLQEPWHCLEPTCGRAHAVAQGSIVPNQQEIQTLEQLRQPKLRILDVRAFVCESMNGHPYFVEQRRAVEFVICSLERQLLDRMRDRTKCSDASFDALHGEISEASIVLREPGSRRLNRIELPPDIQVRVYEVVERLWCRQTALPDSLSDACDTMR